MAGDARGSRGIIRIIKLIATCVTHFEPTALKVSLLAGNTPNRLFLKRFLKYCIISSFKLNFRQYTGSQFLVQHYAKFMEAALFEDSVSACHCALHW